MIVYKVIDSNTGKPIGDVIRVEDKEYLKVGESITVHHEDGKSSPRKIQKIDDDKSGLLVWV